MIHDARVVSLGGNAASNSLLQYGLSFAKLNVLQEHGLIISDYHSYMGYGMCVAADANLALPLRYQNRNWILRPISAANVDRQLLLHGVALSVSGVELMDIVDIQANETYTAAFETFLKARNLTLVEV